MSGARPTSDDTDRLQPPPDQRSSPPRNSEKPVPARYIVEAEMTTVKLPVLTPKPDFLKVIHLGGGVGQTFTMAEIIQHVKEYIRERTLYDLQDPRIVHCGGDLLGKALNVESFTIHEAIALFRKNCTCRQLVAREVCSRMLPTPSTTALPSSTTLPSTTSLPSPSAPRPSPSSTASTTVPFSTTRTISTPSTTRTIAFSSNRGTPSSSARTLPSSSFTTHPSSSVSKTLPSPSVTRTAPSHLSTSSVTDSITSRGSHFPHSFNKNTSLPGSRIFQTFSSQTSVPQPSSSSFPSSSLPFSSFSSKFKAADAVVIITKENLKQSEVVTSSDDERHKVPGASGYDEPDSAGRLRVGEDDIETDGVDQPGGDTVVLAYDSDTFSVEYEIESSSDTDGHNVHDDQDQESDVSSSTSGKGALLIVCKESDVEYLADYSDSDNGSDAELSEADKWLCQTCNTKNPPFQRNCSGCWSIRLDWLPTSTSRPEPAHEEIQTANSSSSETPGCSQTTLSQDSTKVKSSQDKDLTSDSCDCQDSEMASPPPSQSASKRDESCVVCLTRKKTASIIHGKTGHQVCCYRCAKKLKRQRKSCPICRRPIQKVIRNFHL
ncbi:E3 ubiquitin-protein ligase Mdm2-like [Physella acuta]|uniref:E3 ubiquitin-protein ligase Mdm2-like n=1 Tax=Physella acuta TaxID=109671 RepID=UPI0027DC8D41|nr:E3 ubiquitin-protein ligase Mdm2-like [Physella acuta]